MTERYPRLSEWLRAPLRQIAGWPLRVQLAGAFACVMVLSIGLLQITNARATLREELIDSREKQQLLAKKAALALDRHLERAIGDFRFLAANADRLDALHDLAAHMADFGLVGVQVIGSDGRVVLTLPAGAAALPPLPEAADLAELTAGPAGTVRLSGIGRHDGAGFVRIGTVGAQGLTVTGVLSVDFAREIRERVRFGGAGHAAIVDAAGRVIAHPNPAYEAERRDLSTLSVVREALGGQTGAGQFFAPALQAEALAGYAPVPATGWAVIVPRPVAEFEAIARGRLAEQSLIGALIFGLCLVLSSLLARDITRPVGRLTQSAQRIAAGDYRNPLPPTTPSGGSREIAVLEAAFNRMRDEIENSQDSLLTALDLAERESRAKTRFLTLVSHELRTPMNAVLGMLRVLSEEEGGEARAVPLARAEAAAHKLNRLLQDMLEFNGSNAGAETIQPRAFVPRALLGDVIAAVSREADAKGIAIQLVVDPALPERLQADPDRLRRVLTAVVGNAVKFTDRGMVEIGATLRRGGGTGSLLEVRVADTGIGMTPTEQARIFDGFHPADCGYARKRGGLGLGLAIACRLIEGMGGVITVNSRPGKGSLFVITVPTTSLQEQSAAMDLPVEA